MALWELVHNSGKEGDIREQLIKSDLIEAVVALAGGVFYGTGVSACILFLNNQKRPEHKGNAYEDLINKTDELVKSQFIEMFGLENEGMKTIGDVASICRGSSPRPISKYVTDDPEGVNWIKIGDAGEDDVYIIRTSEKITQDGAKKSRAVKPGDFILSNSMSFGRPYILGIDGCVHDGWLIISDYQDYLDPMFFYYELRSDLVQRQFDGSANGSTVKNLNSDRVSKVKIHIPSMELQSEFVELAKQSDKSKFALQEAIKDLDALTKKIIAENLIPAGKE